MWIMLQDETRIVQVIEEIEASGNIIQCRVNSRWTKIGEYKTPERAKEVLWGIFWEIQDCGVAFQMPKE